MTSGSWRDRTVAPYANEPDDLPDRIVQSESSDLDASVSHARLLYSRFDMFMLPFSRLMIGMLLAARDYGRVPEG
jgi:hypothetical protein